MVTHDFRLVLVGDGELQIDQTAFTLTHLTVNDEILVGGFVEIRGHAHLVAEAELVLFQIFIDVFNDGRGYLVAEELKGFFSLPRDLVAAAVVVGLHMEELGLQKFV